MQEFQLKPFTRYPGSDYKLTGNVEREGTKLVVKYLVEGDIKKLVVPVSADGQARRMSGLWETTCFEMFLKNEKMSEYLEFNFSPSGNWNCFSFQGYREGMREFQALSLVDIRLSGNGVSQLELRAEIGLKRGSGFPESQFRQKQIKMGISVVLENIAGIKSYWALSHPTTKADFHDDDAYNIRP